MKWFQARAANLQLTVREADKGNDNHYSEDEIRKAIIHTREDVVVLASYLNSLNEQVEMIKFMIGLFLILAIGGTLYAAWVFSTA